MTGPVSLLLAAAAAGGSILAIRPGDVVRWPGDESVRECLAAGERFAAHRGACWYAVDLETPAGGYELGRVRDGRLETVRVEVSAYPYPEQRLTVEPGYVEPSPENAARAAREAERVRALWSRRGERRFTLPLAAPLEPLPAGRAFGRRRVFNDQPRSPHTGVDFTASVGTPVHSVADGTVALAEEHFYAGKAVFVDHGDGLVSMYFHLSEMAVKAGDRVARGQRLGAVGATGRVTGAHLHFALRWRGARVDPMPLLAPGPPVPTVGAPGR